MRGGSAMREIFEAVDMEWELQQVRKTQLMVGNSMESLLGV